MPPSKQSETTSKKTRSSSRAAVKSTRTKDKIKKTSIRQRVDRRSEDEQEISDSGATSTQLVLKSPNKNPSIDYNWELIFQRSICLEERCSNFGDLCHIGPTGDHSAITTDDITEWLHLLHQGKEILCPPPTWHKGVPCTLKPIEAEPDSDDQPVHHHHHTKVITNVYYPGTAPLYPSLERDEDSCEDDDGRITCFIQSMRANKSEDERDVLWDVRKRLLKERVDLHIIRDMTREDAVYWGIPWGLAKRMKRDVVEYITRNNKGKHGWECIDDLGQGEVD